MSKWSQNWLDCPYHEVKKYLHHYTVDLKGMVNVLVEDCGLIYSCICTENVCELSKWIHQIDITTAHTSENAFFFKKIINKKEHFIRFDIIWQSLSSQFSISNKRKIMQYFLRGFWNVTLPYGRLLPPASRYMSVSSLSCIATGGRTTIWFHGTNTVRVKGRNGLRWNCKVTAPPPFTNTSNLNTLNAMF